MRLSLCLLTTFIFTCTNEHNTTMFVDKCPREYPQWKRRGEQLHCDVKNNITYHCIMNSEERLIEGCLKREARQRGGCPWILHQDKSPIFGATGTETECPTNIKGCPPNNKEYFTDSLYLYPKCLVRKTCRNCSFMWCIPPVTSTTQTSAAVYTENPAGLKLRVDSECSCVAYLIFMIIFLLATLLFTVHLLWNFIKKRRRRNQPGFSRKEPDGELVTPLMDGQQERNPAVFREVNERNGNRNDEEMALPRKGLIIENKATKWTRERLQENADGNNFRTLFLYGINGCGKTTVARHCLGEKCFIINASKKRHLIKSLKRLPDSQSIEFDEDSSKLQTAINDISKKLRDVKLLIDDVEDEYTMNLIHPLFQEVQCVVTTQNANLMYNYDSQSFEVKGLSYEEAMELFDQKNLKNVTLNKDFEELIDILKGSPIDLLCVITQMKEKKVSVKYLLKRIKRNKPETGEMFKPLDYSLSLILKAHPEVEDLVMALQFLSSEGIPICLFITLAAYCANINLIEEVDIDLDKAESIANTFIGALQEVSFGEITGEDDHRKVNVHPKVQYTVLKSSRSPKEKRTLLLKLLKCMSWLFVKDHGHRSDHTRCMDLLPHAEEVIYHFREQKDASPEESLVFVQVCDQIRYTYEVLGYRSNEKKYAGYMMHFVLENILHEGEGYFLSKFHNENLEVFAKEVRRKFREMAKSNEESLSLLAWEYIMYKVRCEHDKENLGKVGERAISDASRLTAEGIKQLRENHLIVMEPSLLARIFTFEVTITALRAFGRFALVFENKGDVFQSFISLIKSLAIHENKKDALQSYKTIRSIGIDFIEIQAACEKPETFEGADYALFIDNIEQSLNDDTKYFKYGLYVQTPKDDLNHELRCRCMILECLRIHDSDEIQSSAERIRELFDRNARSCMEASHSQRAKQGLVKFYIDDGQFEEAINFLEKYDHLNTPEETKGKIDVTSRYDCQDILLRCRCYHSLKQPGNVLDFLVKFDFKIPTEEVEARKLLNEIESIRNESEETALKS